jgi:hypothetical protein
MGHLGHPGSDDLFLAVVRYAPILFVVAGVLAALSDTEALPTGSIRQRLPLGVQGVDGETLARVLEALCTDGLAVRWYEDVDVSGARQERQPVYRRVARASASS